MSAPFDRLKVAARADAPTLRRRRRVPLLVALAGLAVGSPGPAPAQSDAPFLLELRGDLVTVRYTPGSLDRAARVQKRFALLVADFERWSNGERIGLEVQLLARPEWERAGLGSAYGLPGRLGPQRLVLPAWGDAGTVELWRGGLGMPPPEMEGAPMRGTAEEAASLSMSDLMGQVEAARLLLEAAGYRSREPWAGELLAHVVALSAVLKHEAGRLPELDRVFTALTSAAGGAGAHGPGAATAATSLAQRLWLEGAYFLGARNVVHKAEKESAKKLLKLARKNGGELAGADLLDRFPDLGEWLAASFRAAG